MRLFRTINLLEGTSWVLLLAAMPLKYLAHWPLGVMVMGRVHGALFVLFLLSLTIAATEGAWSAGHVLRALGSALAPGGAFWLEGQLRRAPSATGATTSTNPNQAPK